MSDIIKEPMDIITSREVHQLYEEKGLLPENNTLDVTPKDMELCHRHWPDNFEALYEIGAKAVEKFLMERSHVARLLQIEQVRADSWRQHFVLDRCVLHMLQMLHEAISRHYDETKKIKTEGNFYEKLQTFGGRYRSLAPQIPVNEYFYLFSIWTDMHMDFVTLTWFEGPVGGEERSIIETVWGKIINNIKVHFVYGWHHNLYTMSREELEYFARNNVPEKPETTRSRIMSKLTRLLSRESFSDANSEEKGEKASPTRKNSQNSREPSASSLSRFSFRQSQPSRTVQPPTPQNTLEDEINASEPIEICDINLDFLSTPQECSPINLSSHF